MPTASRAERTSRALYALNRLLGLTQQDIAGRLGTAYPTVNRWATGRCIPYTRTLERLEALVESMTADPERERVRSVVARLHMLYGSAHLNNKDNPLDELFFILLSLKTSHRTYEDTYRRFRRRFYPWRKLLSASPEEVESYIRSGGLGSIRARAFVDIAKKLEGDFGEVALRELRRKSDREVEEYLTSLPGVGIKTARCVAMYSLGRDLTPVDTHTYRVGVRLGLVPTSRSTSDAHRHFDAVLPAKFAYPLHTNFVAHGREVCLDPVPHCERCTLTDLCGYFASRQRKRGHGSHKGKADRPFSAQRKLPRPRRRLEVVAADIYAGCGGLSLGLRQAGIKVAYAVDWDKYACETHTANAPETTVECSDVRHVASAEIEKAAGGQVDLLAGGPNCQGLSQLGLRSPDDPRNFMLQEFARLVSEIKPRMFLFENVPGLAHRHNFPVLKGIFQWFRDLGYRCGADVLLAADYGVPQLRYRLFMVGTLDPNIQLTFPAPTHGLGRADYVSVWDAIGDLPPIGPGKEEGRPNSVPYLAEAQGAFQRYARGRRKLVQNHIASRIAEINLARIRHVPEGGNWKDIPADLLPPRLIKCRMMDHSTTYARLHRQFPSFTITSVFGNVTAGAFTHSIQNRAISVREGARLQSFPDSFLFHGSHHSQVVQIGNAVPPLLARAIGSHLRKILLGIDTNGIKPRISSEMMADERAWDALPVLTPRFMPLFGKGTKFPVGWAPEGADVSNRIDGSWKLLPQFRSLVARTGIGQAEAVA